MVVFLCLLLICDWVCLVVGVVVGFVCYFGVLVWMVWVLFFVLMLCGGVGVFLYVWCWVFMFWMDGELVLI